MCHQQKKENEKDFGQNDGNQVQGNKGGAVASWLVHSTWDQAVQVQALARDIVLCSWGDTLLSQCLPPPRCIDGHQLI